MNIQDLLIVIWKILICGAQYISLKIYVISFILFGYFGDEHGKSILR